MKLRTCLLVVTPILALCGQITFADLVKIEIPNNSSVATDRLEQLSKSLSGGSYAPNEQIEQLANSSLNVQLRTSLRDGNRKKTAIHIINQMQSGQIAYTRFYEGSHRYEETLSLYGFTVAYQTMNLIYAKL